MRSLLAYFGRNINEIRDDHTLRIYGAFLALADVLLAFRKQGRFLHEGAEIICWPLIPSCEALRLPSEAAATLLLWTFSGAAAVVALLFLRKRTLTAAYTGLVLLLIVKVAIMAIDFRMRHNAHYMMTIIIGAFLFFPAKRDLTRILLVLFYVAAGTLKLNWEWVSGSATGPFFIFSGSLLVIASAYAAFMELVVVWGLFSHRRLFFWGAMLNLLAFHLVSWPRVGFFYPMVMFCLLAIFPLVWFSRVETQSLAHRFRSGQIHRATPIVAAAFCALQVVPYLYPGDARITGEGRLFALHMIDARVICTARASITHNDGSQSVVDFPSTRERTQCDPIVLYNRARNLCNNRSPYATNVRDMRMQLTSRLSTNPVSETIVDEPGFCQSGLTYHPFRHNEWIKGRSRWARRDVAKG